MLNFLRKIKNKIEVKTPPLLGGIKNKIDLNLPYFNFVSFGELNKDKYFYIIKRSPGTGLFSNVTFVLNHLAICKKFDFIPVIDMENFNTIYNEKKKVKDTMNSWNYYFEPLNQYTLDEVYNSKNVLISSDKFYNFFEYNMDTNKELTEILQNNIKIKRDINQLFLRLSKKFDNKKVLGIHFRGTSYKRAQGHPLPATKKQMLEITKKFLSKNMVDIIFLVTEEKDYLNFFKEKFPNKLFYLKSAFRSNKNDAFKVYPRKFHRYKLGRETMIETLLLSKCDHFIYLMSNVSAAAISFNLNKEQKRYEIKNDYNSKNFFIAQYLWYLKKLLPPKLGGFKEIEI